MTDNNDRYDSLTLAYLAGLMDGEGYFGVYRIKDERYTGGFQYRPQAQVVMTERLPLDLLVKTFGSVVNGPYDNGEGHKQKFTWIAGSRLSAVVARALTPFLILKLRQAILVIEASDLMNRRKQYRISCGRFSVGPQHEQNVRDRMDRIVEECRVLNKRGTLA